MELQKASFSDSSQAKVASNGDFPFFFCVAARPRRTLEREKHWRCLEFKSGELIYRDLSVEIEPRPRSLLLFSIFFPAVFPEFPLLFSLQVSCLLFAPRQNKSGLKNYSVKHKRIILYNRNGVHRNEVTGTNPRRLGRDIAGATFLCPVTNATYCRHLSTSS